jgi:hypothetical protein
MRDLEAKHPSLKRGGEFRPSCRPRYNRGLVMGDEGPRGQASQPQERGRVQPLLQAQVNDRDLVMGDEGPRGQASQPQERGRVQPLLQAQV